MTDIKRLLLIPVENQVRELDPKLLLACIAARRGFSSVIGSRRQLDFRIASLPRGLYLSKSMTVRSIKMFKILRKLGHEIVAWDEEDLVRYASRPYVFTASSSPSVIASTRMALKILQRRSELRQRLWENANTLYHKLQDLGFPVGPEPSPIVAVRLEDKAEAFALWSGLLERGVYVNLVLPPATPDGNCLLRSSVSAGHTPEQMDYICQAFTDAKGCE